NTRGTARRPPYVRVRTWFRLRSSADDRSLNRRTSGGRLSRRLSSLVGLGGARAAGGLLGRGAGRGAAGRGRLAGRRLRRRRGLRLGRGGVLDGPLGLLGGVGDLLGGRGDDLARLVARAADGRGHLGDDVVDALADVGGRRVHAHLHGLEGLTELLGGLLDLRLGEQLVPRLLAGLGEPVVQLQRGVGVLVEQLAQLGRLELARQAAELRGKLLNVLLGVLDALPEGLAALGVAAAGLGQRVADGLARKVARAERGEQRGLDLVDGRLALGRGG